MNTEQPLLLDFTSVNYSKTLSILNALVADNPYLVPALVFAEEWYSGNESFIFQTSGSTGISKTWPVSKDQIIASVNATNAYFNIKSGDNVFICLNLHYTGGKMMLARALHLGLRAYVVQPSNFPFINTAKEFYKLASFVPSQIFTLFNTENHQEYLNSYQNILLGGAPVNQDLKNKCKSVSYTNIYETFGMTETLSHIALKKLSSVYTDQPFKALPGIEVDSDDRYCLRIRGEVTDHNWLETNDVVDLIDEKQFYWRGRFDNIINTGGIKINPEEIENAIFLKLKSMKHDSFYVSSEADVKFGKRLILVIEGKEIEKNLLLILKDILPEHHAPTKIIYQNEFKRTLSGKIIRTL